MTRKNYPRDKKTIAVIRKNDPRDKKNDPRDKENDPRERRQKFLVMRTEFLRNKIPVI